MSILRSVQVRAWYDASLKASGFSQLDDQPREIWKKAVLYGKRALPPGFLGNLMERLTHKSSGIHAGASAFPVEREILETICSKTGFEHLEGVFIMAGSSCNQAFLSDILFQVLDRIPGFFSSNIQITAHELEQGLSDKTNADPGFPANRILRSVYQETLEELVRTPFKLTETDLFEIKHAALFQKPADRIFYRVMMQAVKGIVNWTTGVYSLRAEIPGVVQLFGEPQTLPLGGYDSLSNKGDISSLVSSELAFIDETMAVDLFDYKFFENQLLYFQREEGAVFRIRRQIIVRLELTAFFEHERHLGLLFAWCLILAEKIIETFVKDIVRIRFEFIDYQPSTLVGACEFFRHFLREKGNAERVLVFIGNSGAESAGNPGIPGFNFWPGKLAQNWILGSKPEPEKKFVPVHFPQTDDFSGFEAVDQEKILGEVINNTIEKMVTDAHR